MKNLPNLLLLFVVCFVFTIVVSGFAEEKAKPQDKSYYVELPPFKAENVFYSTFLRPPKTLDPAVSYSSNEALIMGTTYEPPLTYHALKRPYELIPLTAEKMPEFVYRWKKTGKDLSKNEVKKLLGETTPAYTDEEITKIDISLDIKIKKGIYYAPHPCFARDQSGSYKYYKLTGKDIKDFNGDLYKLKITEKDTRELVAEDYVFQLKRLAGPRSYEPLFNILYENLIGVYEYYKEIYEEYEAVREERSKMTSKEAWLYPVRYNFDKYEFKAAEVVDKYTYRLHFKRPNIKFLYHLAMPMFSPMPREAVEFFYQASLRNEHLDLYYCPVGTGPYYLRVFNKDRIESWRNPLYREDLYPSKGEISDKADGFLDDAGKKMPFIDKIIRLRVEESSQIWEEFLKGRFSLSGISESNFEKHIKFANGKPEVSQFLKKRDIKLRTSTAATIKYMAFNMFDDEWGGLSEEKCKLRQAVAIALNMEEFSQKFTNGRNIACHSPIPPSIYGYEKPEDVTYLDNITNIEYYYYIKINDSDKKRTKLNELTDKEKEILNEKYSMFFYKFKNLNKKEQNLAKEQLGRTPNDDELLVEVHFGLNWVVYKWDKTQNKPVRRNLEYAKRLIKEAGIDVNEDKPKLDFLSMGTDSISKEVNSWKKKKLSEISVEMKIDTVEYSKFKELAKEGSFESFEWGWNADYPDSENFLQLLLGKNHKSTFETKDHIYYGGGENAANYINSEYDKLFNQMKNMKDSPKRLRIIRRMINIVRHDSPWILSNSNVYYVLYHNWYKNSKTNLMGNDSYKYRRVDVDRWSKYLEKYADIKPTIPPKSDE